jgi:hypothetical protein
VGGRRKARHPGGIGKCSSTLTNDAAQRLLDEGVPFVDHPGDTYPAQIFDIYQGVPYVAVPTTPGRSYHGYPWQGRMPATVRNELERRATSTGYAMIFRKWMRKYEKT